MKALLWSSLPSLSLGAAQLSHRYGLSRMREYFLPSSAASVALVLLKVVEVFQEEQPGGLLGVIEFGGAAGFFPEDVIDVFESLFSRNSNGFFQWLAWQPAYKARLQYSDAEYFNLSDKDMRIAAQRIQEQQVPDTGAGQACHSNYVSSYGDRAPQSYTDGLHSVHRVQGIVRSLR